MTFEEYLCRVCGLDDIYMITEEEQDKFYEKYLNSEYYNGDKGL